MPAKSKKKVKTTVKKVSASKAASKKKAGASKSAKARPKSRTAKQAKGAKAVKAAKGGRTTKLSFKKEIKQKLLEAKARILAEVAQKVRSESNALKFEIGDIYDIASSERERELALMLGDRDRAKLSEIESALERLEDNTYNICEECGEPIAEDRLRAMPFTRVCVDCKSRNEREQKIRGRVEEGAGFGILEKAEMEDEEF